MRFLEEQVCLPTESMCKNNILIQLFFFTSTILLLRFQLQVFEHDICHYKPTLSTNNGRHHVKSFVNAMVIVLFFHNYVKNNN